MFERKIRDKYLVTVGTRPHGDGQKTGTRERAREMRRGGTEPLNPTDSLVSRESVSAAGNHHLGVERRVLGEELPM